MVGDNMGCLYGFEYFCQLWSILQNHTYASCHVPPIGGEMPLRFCESPWAGLRWNYTKRSI